MDDKLEYIKKVCENELEKCDVEGCPACKIFEEFLEVIEDEGVE